MENWYILRDAQQYGPYSWEQLQAFAKNYQLLKTDMVFKEGSEGWVTAGSVKGLFKKSLKGLIKGLAVITMITLLLVVLIGLAMNRDSNNIKTGKGTTIAKETFTADQGGIIQINDSESLLHGMEIEVPTGSYSKKTNWTVKKSEITEHNLGDNFYPITPLISIKNSGDFSEKPIILSIPIDLPPGYFATAFYYDRKKGTLEGIPTLSLTEDKLVVATHHFSEFVVSIIEIDKISGNVKIDTGFSPGTDDWQFTNYGSYVAPGGHCAGQAISAMWYYYEKKLVAGERGLYGRYDNNDRGYGTIDFWWDDSWGYRLASAVQNDIDWGSRMFLHLETYEGYNDTLTMMAFGHAMLLTGEPQFVGLAETGVPGGHAIIAHRLDEKGLYVTDPNYPGVERFIPFKNGVLGPYGSGANAEDIASGQGVAYDKVGWFAKTSMVPWDMVGKRFAELSKGEVANDIFLNYELEVYVKEGTNHKWVPLKDNYQTTTEETGKVTIQKNNQPYDMTGKLIVRTNPRYTNVYITYVVGTDIISTHRTSDQLNNIIVLEEGTNDIGFIITQKIDNRTRYIDFQRLNIIYNEDDIEGFWEGYVLFEEAGKAINFIVDMIVSIISSIFGEDVTKEALEDAIEIEEFEPLPMSFYISNYDSKTGKCDMDILLIEDTGEEYRTTASGRYKDGVLKFTLVHYDGSKMMLEAKLSGKVFHGEFSMTAWGFLKDAASGSWKVTKQE